MPVIPSVQTLNASSVEILNTIRSHASTTYAERIPEATQENIKEIGAAMQEFPAIANEFLSALVNRIGRVLITSKMYENPLKSFKKGMLEFGESVEEIFVNIAKAHEFDPAVAESEIFKREKPDVQTVFHRLNSQNFYKTTVTNEQLRLAFLSINGVTDLIAKIVDSLYSGAETDEYLTMKQLIVNYATDGRFKVVNIPTVNASNAKSIVATMKAVSNKLEFMSSVYNHMGVATFTKKENQIILLDADFDATIDVEVLASAFNMDKVQFMGQRVLLDNFGTLTGCVAAIVDRDFFMVFDNLVNFTEQYNGQGMYWNYWYHVWKTFSVSPFSNAVLFTTATPAITSVTLTPATDTIIGANGGYIQFLAEVVSTGYADDDVKLEISAQTTADDTIVLVGNVLIVPAGTAANSVTVKATSVTDATKTDTSVITIS
jgi:hypothetical protein